EERHLVRNRAVFPQIAHQRRAPRAPGQFLPDRGHTGWPLWHYNPGMRFVVFLAVFAIVPTQFPPPSVDIAKSASPEWLAPYREPASKLLGEALASDEAWQRLAYI